MKNLTNDDFQALIRQAALQMKTYGTLMEKTNKELISLAIAHCMPFIDTGENIAAVQLMLEIFHRLEPSFGAAEAT